METPDRIAWRRAVAMKAKLEAEEKRAIDACRQRATKYVLENIVPQMNKASNEGKFVAHFRVGASAASCDWQIWEKDNAFRRDEILEAAAKDFVRRAGMEKVDVTVGSGGERHATYVRVSFENASD